MNRAAIYIFGISLLIGTGCMIPRHPLRAVAVAEGVALWLFVTQSDSRDRLGSAGEQEVRSRGVELPALW